ncbi:MAG: hypothetical protein AAFO94_21695, partial [Bacteroidota bacterium]
MKDLHVGYYAHHGSNEHLHRAQALLRSWSCRATLLSAQPYSGNKSEPYRFMPLPAKNRQYDGSGLARSRMHLISEYFRNHRPDIFITDVSADLTHYARELKVPTVMVRPGSPTHNFAQVQAYRNCKAMLFPLPSVFEKPDTPGWVREKTFYATGICSHSGKYLSVNAARRLLHLPLHEQIVLVSPDVYSGPNGERTLLNVVRHQPRKYFVKLGAIQVPPEQLPANLRLITDYHSNYPWIRAADMVVINNDAQWLTDVALAQKPI